MKREKWNVGRIEKELIGALFLDNYTRDGRTSEEEIRNFVEIIIFG